MNHLCLSWTFRRKKLNWLDSISPLICPFSEENHEGKGGWGQSGQCKFASHPLIQNEFPTYWLSISNPEGVWTGHSLLKYAGFISLFCLLLCKGLPSSFGQLYLSAAREKSHPKDPLVVIAVGNGGAKDELKAFQRPCHQQVSHKMLIRSTYKENR